MGRGGVEANVGGLRRKSRDHGRDVRLLQLGVEREVDHLTDDPEGVVSHRALGLAASERQQDVDALTGFGDVQTLVQHQRRRVVVAAEGAVDEGGLVAGAFVGPDERWEDGGRGRGGHSGLPLRPVLVLVPSLVRVPVRSDQTHLQPVRLLRGHHEALHPLVRVVGDHG